MTMLPIAYSAGTPQDSEGPHALRPNYLRLPLGSRYYSTDTGELDITTPTGWYNVTGVGQVDSVTAADSTITVGGTPTNPTIGVTSDVFVPASLLETIYSVLLYGPRGTLDPSGSYKTLAGVTQAVGDGSGTLLSNVYPTLAAAQVVYPAATSLTQTVDWAAQQAAMNAAPVYSTVFWETANGGLYLINTSLIFPGHHGYMGESRMVTIQQAAGANIASGGLLVSREWANSDLFTGNPVEFRNLTIDGNSANNTGAVDCIVSQNYASKFDDLFLTNPTGNGLQLTDNNAGGSIAGTAVENRVSNIKVASPAAHGIWINDTVNALTDGFITDCLVQSPGADGIFSTRGGGWKVVGNHIYGASGMGIQISNCYATRITNNYVEGFGAIFYNGGSVAGILAACAGTRGVVIEGNQVYNTDNLVNGNTAYRYISATGSGSPIYATIGTNICYGSNSTLGIGIDLEGTITALVSPNNILSNFNATKFYFVAGTATLLQSPGVSGTAQAVKTTGTTGYTLINGTGTVLSYATPHDDRLHTVSIPGSVVVTTTEVGGAIQLNYTLGGVAKVITIDAGAHTTGTVTNLTAVTVVADPNSTVTVTQSSALTTGAAVLYAKIVCD